VGLALPNVRSTLVKPARVSCAAQAMDNYLRAKDGNRPHWMAHAFASDAQLAMVVQTNAISFPAACHGRDAITETLVRRFGQTYENVYTFYLSAAPVQTAIDFQCRWLVVMTEKASGAVRVGCGHYDWKFDTDSHLATHLTITIEAMHLLDAAYQEPVMAWASGLPYPWCTGQQSCTGAPDIAPLQSVLQCAL
jgi:hypothetical protein